MMSSLLKSIMENEVLLSYQEFGQKKSAKGYISKSEYGDGYFSIKIPTKFQDKDGKIYQGTQIILKASICPILSFEDCNSSLECYIEKVYPIKDNKILWTLEVEDNGNKNSL